MTAIPDQRQWKQEQPAPDPTAELDGSGVSGRDEITPADARRLPSYSCRRCGGTGSMPTHRADCEADVRASTLWRTPLAAGARAALAEVDARRNELIALPADTPPGEHEDARLRMHAAEASASNKLAGLLAALDHAAGVL